MGVNSVCLIIVGEFFFEQITLLVACVMTTRLNAKGFEATRRDRFSFSSSSFLPFSKKTTKCKVREKSRHKLIHNVKNFGTRNRFQGLHLHLVYNK